MPSQTVNIPRDTTLQDTNAKLQAIAEIIGGNPMIAEKFSTESSYAAGEYCINDGEFEKFTAAKSAGAWDASKATETTVGEELTALNSTLAQNNVVLYSKETYQNDVGSYITLSDSIANYNMIALTVYITVISSTSRASLLVSVNKRRLAAAYVPIVINNTSGNIRIESQSDLTKLNILSTSFGNTLCVGEVIGYK